MAVDIFNKDNLTDVDFSEAIRAEEYTRMYKWISQDFISSKDMRDFSNDFVSWARSIERRLSMLSKKIATHTHAIPPHTHAAFGTPNIGGTTTLIPNSHQSLIWSKSEPPKNITNTTGAKTNLNNKISKDRIPKIGDVKYGEGRSEIIPILKNLSSRNRILIQR